MLAITLALGCGSGTPTDGDTAQAFAYGAVGTYDPSFAPLTWSYLSADDSSTDLFLSLTDRDGLVDCGLASDFGAVPVAPARQLVVRLRDANYSDCPSGLVTIGACDDISGEGLGADCARYRAWDDAGEPTADLNATTGAVRVTDGGGSCTFELELTFDGGSFVETGSIAYDEFQDGPFCTQ
ncbi:MAG: hypothetical protein ABMB14_23780 [Myxococcota bacterium]